MSARVVFGYLAVLQLVLLQLLLLQGPLLLPLLLSGQQEDHSYYLWHCQKMPYLPPIVA